MIIVFVNIYYYYYFLLLTQMLSLANYSRLSYITTNIK